MTKVGRLFEEEKIEYAQEYANKKVNKKVLEIAKNLLAKNIDILTIMETTGLSKTTILKLREDSQETPL